MNTEKNSLGSIITVVVFGVVAVTGILFGGKELIKDRIEHLESVEVVERSEGGLGGLVHNVQEIFSAGIKAGSSEVAVINSSGEWVGVINGTTGAFSGAITGATTFTMTGETNLDTLVYGGDVTQIGYGTTTITAAQVCDNSIIKIGLVSDVAATVTLPATTTLNADCLSTDGDTKQVLVYNNATSTLVLTLVAGSGIDMQEHVGEGDVLISEDEYARITFTRLSNATTVAEVIQLQPAD